MRQALHIPMAVLLALGTGACGELENAPFRIGTVHGQLTESDPAVALVSVIGAPDLRSPVAPDGTFTLEGVPAGAAELFIVASASKALRVPLIVQGGQSVTVGVLAPKEASFLSVRVKAPDHQSVDEAQVSLVGTPLQGLRPNAMGRLTLGPLPDGCYTLGVSLSSFPMVSVETCVNAGEDKEVRVNLPSPDSGCGVTGCSDGFRCAPNDRCVECLEDSHCGPGFACRNSQCEDGPVCSPCEADWKCRAGASCQAVPEGGMACLEKCAGGDACKDGFTCQSGLCLPDAAQFSGCSAFRGLGASCEVAERCRALGLLNGACHASTCTLRCSSDEECPDSYSCEDTDDGRLCLPEE